MATRKRSATSAFSGCYTALATPFDAQARVDEEALRRLVAHQLKGGVAGLVACGSTGEAATLTHGEYRRVLQLVIEASRGEVPVIAGVGANATWKALELAREAESLGADGLLLLTPYYNKPVQDGLYQHFRAVARATRLPVILYNIPGRCAVNLLPRTLAQVAADCGNVVAIKEAAGSLDQVSEILTLMPSFCVLSGDDSLTLPMMAVGARGAVSVVSNVAPALAQELCEAALQGNLPRARQLHARLFPLVKSLFLETNPIPVKAALELIKLCRAEPRLPLTSATGATRDAVRVELKKLGIL